LKIYWASKIGKEMVMNRAFDSLSFRERRCDRHKSSEVIVVKRKAKTYGGILCKKGVTVEDDEYVLVQGRYTGKWSFPKGHSNEGEEPLKCSLREVAEETGLDDLPEPTEYLQIGYGNYFVFNLERKIELVPRDKGEIMNTRWVRLEEMRKMLLNADVSIWCNSHPVRECVI
jgi:8-oxo-dGTP pyrophosphatase MutT (NUDIX family)